MKGSTITNLGNELIAKDKEKTTLEELKTKLQFVKAGISVEANMKFGKKNQIVN